VIEIYEDWKQVVSKKEISNITGEKMPIVSMADDNPTLHTKSKETEFSSFA
jgi:hypothetical protein